MAEFLVGLVCIMLLVIGLQQIAFISEKGFLAMNNTRHQMAIQYAEDPPEEWLEFNFSSPAQPGPDGKDFTADDLRSGGNDSVYQDYDGYLDMVYDDVLEGFIVEAGRISPHVDLNYSSGIFSTTPGLDMMYAQDYQSVEAVPFMNKVLGRDRILIGRNLWMPRWSAIP